VPNSPREGEDEYEIVGVLLPNPIKLYYFIK